MAENAAEYVMYRLRDAGHEAFLVGGCVRDILLQRTPKDFDVTTSATPEQVTALFPGQTIPVGAAFGVTVYVDHNKDQIEIATYRSDGQYSDGRRPDSVTYGKTAQEDVERRDFTINGLLCKGQADGTSVADYERSLAGTTRMNVGGKVYGIIDFVGGIADVQRGVIRAIGDPNKRFEEDALRMLRAVRFSAQLGFDIETKTCGAIIENADRLRAVSRERIAMELFKILTAPDPVRGLIALFTTGLAKHCLPAEFREESKFTYTMERFNAFKAEKDPMLGLSMFLADCPPRLALTLSTFLKLSGAEREQLVNAQMVFLPALREHVTARTVTRARMKRMCRLVGKEIALELFIQDELIRKTSFGLEAVMGVVQEFRALTPEDINPAPLVTGKDLIDMGLTPGPIFTEILREIEDGQLEGVLDRETALSRVKLRVWVDDEGRIDKEKIV